MGNDNNGFDERIQKNNQQNSLSDSAMNQIMPTLPKKSSDRLSEYIPGFILIVWTIFPILLISLDSYLILQLCFYPLLSPLIWFILGKLKPESGAKTIALGLVGHVLLAGGIWWSFKTAWGGGSFFALDAIAALLIIAVLILSALGYIFVILSGVDHAKRALSKSIE